MLPEGTTAVREGTFYWMLLAMWFVLAIAAFFALLVKPAPYGRFSESAWGPKLPPRIAWLLMEGPAAVLFSLLFLFGTHKNAVAVAFFAIWNIHYVYRGFIYPCLTRSTRSVPMTIVASAICFQVVNSYLQARWLFALGPEYPLSWLSGACFICGVSLFFVGMAITISSDAILRSLRSPGDNLYHIPHGGLFRWISCPNYFGEILEWSAWAILTWSPAGLAFAVWTAANLVPRAISHHRWYHKTFSDYPVKRKAVIPFVL
ncbi:MAG: DUF1295 domain-containing protein [Pirellulales bacterium]|nr:DUF1295 domain-containing protein [Pirellulales bacterium]